MWRTDKVNPAPDSWGAVFDGELAVQGQGHGVRQPDLHRRRGAVPEGDPARPRHRQPVRARREAVPGRRRPAQAAARDHRRVLVGLHQGAGRVHERRLRGRHHLAGDREPARGRQGADQDRRCPKEGATGWSDTWMISSKAKNPNCMYMWMDHIISPKANAAVAEWFGEAPSNAKSCAETAVKNHCEIFHADDEDYFYQVAYWTTPRRSAATIAERSARTTPSGSRPGRRSRAEPQAPLRAGPACSCRCCSAGPVGWLVVAYLGSLAVLFVAASGGSTRSRGQVVHDYSLQNFQTLIENDVYRTIVAPHDADRRGGDGHRRAAGVPDRVLHGQDRAAARARAAGRRGADAAVVELPGEGLRLADRSWPRTGSSTGRSARSG